MEQHSFLHGSMIHEDAFTDGANSPDCRVEEGVGSEGRVMLWMGEGGLQETWIARRN